MVPHFLYNGLDDFQKLDGEGDLFSFGFFSFFSDYEDKQSEDVPLKAIR